ncbi:MAG: hypothetical protein R3C68_06495 [Myxococcota bacterium]
MRLYAAVSFSFILVVLGCTLTACGAADLQRPPSPTDEADSSDTNAPSDDNDSPQPDEPVDLADTALDIEGDGRCSGDEDAVTSPEDCIAVAGDSACTHDEDAQSTPEDCPSEVGDSFCTHNENAASAAEDCLPVVGDGFCTHDETNLSAPEDCPGVRGDGLCTHNESAATTPEDCPVDAHDSLCTHDENAHTNPEDCPAVAGDGFCTHDEDHVGAPTDCLPPDVDFDGGNLTSLRRLSANLVFGNLRLLGDLRLTGSGTDDVVTIQAKNFSTQGGGIRVVRNDCDWNPAPSLVISASESVVINDPIDLSGRNGKRVAPGAQCNRCDGAAGGHVVVEAPVIRVNSDIRSTGGRGMTLNMEGNLIVGCDGAEGGSISLNATSELSLGQARMSTGGGEGGLGSQGRRGNSGSDGIIEWLSPRTQLSEMESNGSFSVAQPLPWGPLTLIGQTGVDDDYVRQGTATAMYINFDAGEDPDFVEDMFVIDVPEQTDISTSLHIDVPEADLDLYLFDAKFRRVAQSNASSGDESFRAAVAAGRYYIVVSYCCGLSSSTYTLSVNK